MKIVMAVIFILIMLAGCVESGYCEKWSRAYIRSLPDSAFAVVETGPKGEKLRRLPHHDLSGAVDKPHLEAALRLWHRTKWIDSVNAKLAWEHLQRHVAELRKTQSASDLSAFKRK